ncbi:MAG: rhodanese-like domain-containing protein [Lysobacterales bacterium]
MILATAFVALLAFLISHEFAQFARKYKVLTPQGLTLLINRQSPLLIDMSSQKDFDAGHIVGARHVPLSQFDPEHKDLAKVREMPLAVYCGNGQTSAAACARLAKAGFTQVNWLDGGLAAWRAASLPVTRDKR